MAAEADSILIGYRAVRPRERMMLVENLIR
jgi:hypothetical protein